MTTNEVDFLLEGMGGDLHSREKRMCRRKQRKMTETQVGNKEIRK